MSRAVLKGSICLLLCASALTGCGGDAKPLSEQFGSLPSGYTKKWDIGKSDTLVLFNTCQTKSLSARTSWLDDITGTPKVCDVNFVKRLSQACKAYKAVLKTQWAQNDWFMYQAASQWRHCGLWVVDEASWRPPKVKPASYGPGSQYLGNIQSIAPGATEYVKTATGSIPVT